MTNPFQTLKIWRLQKAVVLITGVSALALIAGCSNMKFKNPFTDDRPEQVLKGGRRMPLLNEGDMARASGQVPPPQVLVPSQMPPISAMSPPPAPAVPPAQMAMQQDNFDYYGAAAASLPQQDPASGRMLGTLNPAPVKADAARPARPARKPIPGNLQYEALGQMPASGMVPPPSYTSMPSQAFDATTAEPVMEKPVAAAKPKEPSFFERIFGSSQSDSAPEDAEAPPVEQNTPYPALSSVPAAPSQFNEIRTGRQQEMHDLQNAQAQAWQEQQALITEPSQQQNVMPVEMPRQPQAAAAPMGDLPQLQQSMPPAQAESAEMPRQPRRGIDIMTQEEWDAMQKAREMGQSMPPQSMAPAQTPYPVTEPAPTLGEPLPQETGMQASGGMTPAPMDAAPAAQSIAPAAVDPNPIEPADMPAADSHPIQPEQEGQGSAPRQPYWWEGWGSRARPPSDTGGDGPQSALPWQGEVVADNKLTPEPPIAAETETLEVAEAPAVEDTSNMQTVEDAQTKRPSFFARLFGGSPGQAQTDDAKAAAETKAATDTASSDEETADARPAEEVAGARDTGEEQPEWVRRWLSKSPAAKDQPDDEAQQSSTQDLAVPPHLEKLTEKAVPSESAAAPAAGEEPAPAEVAAEEVPLQEEPVRETVKQENPPTSKDWLQSLMSRSQQAEPEKLRETEIADTALPQSEERPAAGGDSSNTEGAQLIGQMTDKDMLKLAHEPAEDIKEQPETEKAVAAEVPAPAETAETRREKPSFFERLFSGKSRTEDAKEEDTVAAAPQEPVTTAAEEMPAPEAPKEEAVAQTPVDEPQAPAEETIAASEPAPPLETKPEKPSFFSRLFAPKKPAPEPEAMPVAEVEPAPAVPEEPVEAAVTEIEPVAAEEPAPAAIAAPQAPAEPEMAAAADAPKTENEAEVRKPSLFSRLFGGGSASKDKENKQDATGDMQGTEASSVISAAAPVVQVTTGGETLPEKDNAVAASASSALPSPQILKEIKMMPPSRYSARRRALQKEQTDY